MLAEHLISFHLHHSFDLVVPIPLHPKKLKLRGYNQAEIISAVIGEKLTINHAPHLLKRVKKNSTQTKKTRDERALTNNNPFILNQPIKPNTHILLIDDIITTGNTLEAACAVLSTLNVKISIATIAFAVKH